MTVSSDTREIVEGEIIPVGFSHAIREDKEYLFFRNERIVMEFCFPKETTVTCDIVELKEFENPHFSFGEDLA